MSKYSNIISNDNFNESIRYGNITSVQVHDAKDFARFQSGERGQFLAGTTEHGSDDHKSSAPFFCFQVFYGNQGPSPTVTEGPQGDGQPTDTTPQGVPSPTVEPTAPTGPYFFVPFRYSYLQDGEYMRPSYREFLYRINPDFRSFVDKRSVFSSRDKEKEERLIILETLCAHINEYGAGGDVAVPDNTDEYDTRIRQTYVANSFKMYLLELKKIHVEKAKILGGPNAETSSAESTSGRSFDLEPASPKSATHGSVTPGQEAPDPASPGPASSVATTSIEPEPEQPDQSQGTDKHPGKLSPVEAEGKTQGTPPTKPITIMTPKGPKDRVTMSTTSRSSSSSSDSSSSDSMEGLWF